MPLFIGTDIGGTFTDLVGYDSQKNALFYGKRLTDYGDLVEGVLDCLSDVGLEPRSVDILKHGTTQVINTLLERRGAKTALLTTRGFRDILEIGRAGRPLAFRLDYQRLPPLVPRELRYEIDERIDGEGRILSPLKEAELDSLAAEFRELKIEAIAVSFLNAYRNPVHEDQAVRRLREQLPGVYVTCGSELSREWYEYERSSTAVANAFVGPRTEGYIERFDARLAGESFGGRFFMMASNGGVLSVRRAKEQPIALVESGPIGGCIGAAVYARELGAERLIAFDMGGTTAKCALVEKYAFDVQGTYYVGGYEHGFPLRTPVLDIVEVGTGGGSIAHVDGHGRLHVGPKSAGSEPGPVCFGRGGTEPTVTDANIILDRIGTGAFLGGNLKLDRAAALHALEERVARPLGYGGGHEADTVAAGILTLANAQMASAIKEITIERGRDIRDFELFVFGGGGPLHGPSLARELRIPRVTVPPEPGNFSALGMLFADARIDESHTCFAPLAEESLKLLRETLAGMRSSVTAALRRDFDAAHVAFDQHAEMRYQGQRSSIRVGIGDADSATEIHRRFIATYRGRYGHADEASAVEFIGLRVAGAAVTERPDIMRLHRAGTEGRPEPRSHREIHFHKRVRTPVYVRNSLPIGFRLGGPAVIEEFGATTVIGPGDRLEVGRLGELRIEVAA
jgi:N-methylhydantoinase A